MEFEQETYLERIKKVKSSKKITNDRLSEMTGIPLGTLSKILAGISDSPKLSNMVAISQALGCSLDWMISGVPENTNNCLLTAEELNLIEDYRAMDDYGRKVLSAVASLEKERAAAQVTLHASADEASKTRGVRRNAHVRRHPIQAEGRVVRPLETAEMAESAKSAQPIKNTAGGAVILSGVTSASPAKIGSTGRTAELPVGLRRRDIDLYDMPVSAGPGEFLSGEALSTISIPDLPQTSEATFALRISGNSMEPKYRNGDVLLVQECESVEEGELGIFILDGSGYFKKYGGDRLISLNPSYSPILLKDFRQVSCCGRVVGKLKKK